MQPISNVFDGFQHEIASLCQAKYGMTPSTNAFSNVRGAWFESVTTWFLYELWLSREKFTNRYPYYILKLGNVSQSDFRELFAAKEENLLDELSRHLNSMSISLETSNPDYAVVLAPQEDTADLNSLLRHRDPKETTDLSSYTNLYRSFLGKCAYTDFVCALGLKDSIRPDRRYQLVYEGNVFKSVFIHLKTRFWDFEYSVPPYLVGIGTKDPSDSDVKALRTASLATITDVNVTPEPAVDNLFFIDKISDFSTLLDHIEDLVKRRYESRS